MKTAEEVFEEHYLGEHPTKVEILTAMRRYALEVAGELLNDILTDLLLLTELKTDQIRQYILDIDLNKFVK